MTSNNYSLKIKTESVTSVTFIFMLQTVLKDKLKINQQIYCRYI